MEKFDDPYVQFRPPDPTPDDEICGCPADTPVKLVSLRELQGFNPLRCLDCNGEVPVDRLALTLPVLQAVSFWDSQHGAITALELASSRYEAWARQELLDPQSATNQSGLEAARLVNASHPCFFSFFDPDSDEDWKPRDHCPVCNGHLVRYRKGKYPQLLCERDRVVVGG
ncbi:MAG: hypothetical protein E6J23_02330 [Chloroflexi bacterium]|nr:MAG: hypothetical protein E6J23_02330 [Chloroflexota bacterium]